MPTTTPTAVPLHEVEESQALVEGGAASFVARSPSQRNPSPVATPTNRLYRLSVRQYDAMTRAGILTSDDKVELYEGLLLNKMTKNNPHIGATRRIFHRLMDLISLGWFPTKEDPLELARSVPEPDVALVRGVIDDYLDRMPGPGEIGLVIEVADSTYTFDSQKRIVYADAGIPYYWIVNLKSRHIEVYSDPTGVGSRADYQRREDLGIDTTIPVVLDDQEVIRLAIRDLLPPESDAVSE